MNLMRLLAPSLHSRLVWRRGLILRDFARTSARLKEMADGGELAGLVPGATGYECTMHYTNRWGVTRVYKYPRPSR